MGGQRWSEEEVKLLLCNINKTSVSLLPLFPTRTLGIAQKREDLGWHRQKYEPPQLSDAERGYFAGLIDGEGCFVFPDAIRNLLILVRKGILCFEDFPRTKEK